MKLCNIIIMVVFTLFFNSCSEQFSRENTSEPFYGDIVSFSLNRTKYSVNDSIELEKINYSGSVYLYSYCGIPFAVLKKEENHWTYVFPVDKECSVQENILFEPNVPIVLSDIRTRENEVLIQGSYMLKILYSTYAPGAYMREHNIEIEISG